MHVFVFNNLSKLTILFVTSLCFFFCQLPHDCDLQREEAEKSQEKKKDDKEEKKRLEAAKKEQKEREKKEQDARKKFKVSEEGWKQDRKSNDQFNTTKTLLGIR